MLSSKESGGVFWEAAGVSSWRGAFIKLDDILLIMAGGKEFLEREWGGDEILCKKVKVLFIQIVLLVVFYCQCLIRSGRRKYSQINVQKQRLRASGSSIIPIGIFIIIKMKVIGRLLS